MIPHTCANCRNCQRLYYHLLIAEFIEDKLCPDDGCYALGVCCIHQPHWMVMLNGTCEQWEFLLRVKQR